MNDITLICKFCKREIGLCLSSETYGFDRYIHVHNKSHYCDPTVASVYAIPEETEGEQYE